MSNTLALIRRSDSVSIQLGENTSIATRAASEAAADAAQVALDRAQTSLWRDQVESAKDLVLYTIEPGKRFYDVALATAEGLTVDGDKFSIADSDSGVTVIYERDAVGSTPVDIEVAEDSRNVLRYDAAADGVAVDDAAVASSLAPFTVISGANFTRDLTQGGRIYFPGLPNGKLAIYRITTPIVMKNDNVHIETGPGAIILDDCTGPWLTVGEYDNSWPNSVHIHVDCQKNGSGTCIDIAGATSLSLEVNVAGSVSARNARVINALNVGQVQDMERLIVTGKNINGFGVKFTRSSKNEGHFTVPLINITRNGGEWEELPYKGKLVDVVAGDVLTGALSGATAVVVESKARTAAAGSYCINRKLLNFTANEDLMVGPTKVAEVQSGAALVPLFPFAVVVFEADATADASGISAFQIGRMDIRQFTARTTAIWKASTAYAVGDEIVPSTIAARALLPLVYAVCTVAGTSDAVVPTWPLTENQLFTSGGATFRTYMRPQHDGILVYERNAATPHTFASTNKEVVSFVCGASFFENFTGDYIKHLGSVAPKMVFGSMETFGGGTSGGFNNGNNSNSALLSIDAMYENSPNTYTANGKRLFNWKGSINIKSYYSFGRTSATVSDGFNRGAARFLDRTIAGRALDKRLTPLLPGAIAAWQPNTVYALGAKVRPTGRERLTVTGYTGGPFRVGETVISADGAAFGTVRKLTSATYIWVEYDPRSRRFVTGDTVTGVASQATKTGTLAPSLRYVGLYLECTTAGTSANTDEPAWAGAAEATIVDGTVTWTLKSYGDGFAASGATTLNVAHTLPNQPLTPDMDGAPPAPDTSWGASARVTTVSAVSYNMEFSIPAPLGIGGSVSGRISATL